LNRQQRSGNHDRHGRQATRHSQIETPARGTALQPGAMASPTVKIVKQSHLSRFKSDITPISRPLKKRTPGQDVSTILPICALVSMSA
jgi:hypothetical protein